MLRSHSMEPLWDTGHCSTQHSYTPDHHRGRWAELSPGLLWWAWSGIISHQNTSRDSSAPMGSAARRRRWQREPCPRHSWREQTAGFHGDPDSQSVQKRGKFSKIAIQSYSNSYILFKTLANRGILKGHPDFQQFEKNALEPLTCAGRAAIFRKAVVPSPCSGDQR